MARCSSAKVSVFTGLRRRLKQSLNIYFIQMLQAHFESVFAEGFGLSLLRTAKRNVHDSANHLGYFGHWAEQSNKPTRPAFAHFFRSKASHAALNKDFFQHLVPWSGKILTLGIRGAGISESFSNRCERCGNLLARFANFRFDLRSRL